jgi:hypothetical protein
MSRKAQRPGNNTVHHASEIFSSSSEDIGVPSGFDKDRQGFMELWRNFVQARAKQDWLPSDLHFLAKVVDIEIDIQEQTAFRREEGFLVLNPKETALVENPRNRVIESLTRIQLSIIGKLSITAGVSQTLVVRGAAMKALEGKTSLDADGYLLAN